MCVLSTTMYPILNDFAAACEISVAACAPKFTVCLIALTIIHA